MAASPTEATPDFDLAVQQAGQPATVEANSDAFRDRREHAHTDRRPSKRPACVPLVADPFWDTAWKVIKCAGAIAATVFVGSKAYKIIKELGGAWNAAKLLVKAGNFHDFAATAGAAAAGVLGVETIRKNCF
jgi:hypothetical protein